MAARDFPRTGLFHQCARSLQYLDRGVDHEQGAWTVGHEKPIHRSAECARHGSWWRAVGCRASSACWHPGLSPSWRRRQATAPKRSCSSRSRCISWRLALPWTLITAIAPQSYCTSVASIQNFGGYRSQEAGLREADVLLLHLEIRRQPRLVHPHRVAAGYRTAAGNAGHSAAPSATRAHRSCM
jgi:hypothetical protein